MSWAVALVGFPDNYGPSLYPELYPVFATLIDAQTPTAIAQVKTAYNTEQTNRGDHPLLNIDSSLYVAPDLAYQVSADSSTPVVYRAVIKRVQNYSVKVTNSSQSLCSLKEIAFTKISGFRKYTL